MPLPETGTTAIGTEITTLRQAAGETRFAAYWRTVAARVARVDATPYRAGEFACEIAERSVGFLQLMQIQSDPVLLRRSLACISGDPRAHYVVSLIRSGTGVIRHDGGEVLLQPHTFALIDKALPYETSIFERSGRLLVSIPRHELERRLPDPERYLRTGIRADRGFGRVVADYIESLFAEAQYLDPTSRASAAEICLDLIAAVLASGTASFAAHAEATARLSRHGKAQALLSRIKAYIRCHLCDPDLLPAHIATAHGISKRYLHALFAGIGTSVGTWIRDERLARTHADLGNPRLGPLSVTEIALRHGFNDIPHFTRQFKARYGVPPSAIRAPLKRR